MQLHFIALHCINTTVESTEKQHEIENGARKEAKARQIERSNQHARGRKASHSISKSYFEQEI